MLGFVIPLLVLNHCSAWAASTTKSGSILGYDQEEINHSKLSEGTLKQVHIIFRHGDRAPVSTFPNDPNINHEWQYGRGQLTEVGKQQLFELGTFLRDRYSHFLTSDPREVLVRSSIADRCLSSAQTNLAAFFRPTGKWIWNKDLLWQPVPILTAPAETDWLLNGIANCPVIQKIALEVLKSPEGVQFTRKYKGLYDHLTAHSGSSVRDPVALTNLYDILLVNKFHNLATPPWVEQVWSEFTEACHETLALIYTHKPFSKLKGGHLLGHILNLMKKYDQESHSSVYPKAFMYSTHDGIVAALLGAMGVFNGNLVPYASTVLVELRKHSSLGSKYSVRVYYRNTTVFEPYEMVVPGCQQDCPLEDFERLVQDSIPKDIEKECAVFKKEAQKHMVDGTIHTDSETQGATASKMKELVFQMRQLMTQPGSIVDRPVQELIREIEDLAEQVQ